MRTSSGSRTSRIDDARIKTAIAMLASGSIGRQPVARMTAPETTTATAPSASAAE